MRTRLSNYRVPTRRQTDSTAGLLAKLALVVLLAVLAIASCRAYMNSKQTITIKVTYRERIADGTHSKYLIYAEGETFECTDSSAFGKYNSSDVYGLLEPGHRYEVTVVGWRNKYHSQYRNILTARRLD